jgi:hypothetical protein
MTRTVVGILGLLVLVPALQAQDKREIPPSAQQYQLLDKEYWKAWEEYRKAIANAKTREEKVKVAQEKSSWPDDFGPRFLELAEKNPKASAAVDALIWIATHGTMNRNQQSKSIRGKAFQILLRDHVQKEKMTALYPALGDVGLGYARDKESQLLLHAVLEENKHRTARAFACLALAEQAEGCLRAAQELKDDPKQWTGFYGQRFGKDAVEALIKADPDKLSKEAESFYERVIKEFAEVSDRRGNKLGEEAKQQLDKLRHPIVIGKPAPEIEGEDIEGVKFRLSDYRGKVVLLDFWGHW